MFEPELEDSAMAQAYKHRWIRRYLVLDAAGRAYVAALSCSPLPRRLREEATTGEP